MGFLRQEHWSGFPFPSPVDHILSDLSTMTCPSWVAPRAWLSFIELTRLWSMWSDWLVFCDCGFSVFALWCPLATPTILLGFLLPWPWGISSGLLQQSAATAPYLGRGVSPQGRPSWIWMWSSSSRSSSCTHAATTPWTWGCSFIDYWYSSCHFLWKVDSNQLQFGIAVSSSGSYTLYPSVITAFDIRPWDFRIKSCNCWILGIL